MSLALAALIIGLGFVSSAFLHTVDQIIRGRPSYLVIHSPSLLPIIGTFFLCMLIGPYITAERSFVFWLQGKIGGAILGMCCVISVLWSFCSGVFFAQILMLFGLVHA